jgi:hypothetical protein
VRLPIELPLLRTSYGVLTLAGRSLAPAAPVFIERLRAVVAQTRRAEPVGPRAREAPRPRRKGAAHGGASPTGHA